MSTNTIACRTRDTKYQIFFSAIGVQCVVKVQNAGKVSATSACRDRDAKVMQRSFSRFDNIITE